MIEAPKGKLVVDDIIPYNLGHAYTIKMGQYIRVIGRTTVDFVAFNMDNLIERFDQGRRSYLQASRYTMTTRRYPPLAGSTSRLYCSQRSPTAAA